MPLASTPAGTPCSGSWRSVFALALAPLILGLLPGGAHAELLATYPHRNGAVHLMSELCREDDPSSGQRAAQTVGGLERYGCWGVDRAGNPIVAWGDGSELVLYADKVEQSRRRAGLPRERTEAPQPRAAADASTPSARPRTEAPRVASPETSLRSAAASRGFMRPVWCSDAHFPHERLVCTDAELADGDLRLASLWEPYRRTLSRGAEAWHKSDYFRRLKMCGADKACIVSEQETQMRRYREGLRTGG